jgi:hypothetical protein
VDLTKQASRERETVPNAVEAVLECRHIGGDLLDVVEGDPGCGIQLEQEQIRQGGLCPLDLRGEHRLLPDVGVDEEGGVGEQGRDGIQATEGDQGEVEGLAERSRHVEGRRRRERLRDERADGFFSNS